jgi:hypothetical protein
MDQIKADRRQQRLKKLKYKHKEYAKRGLRRRHDSSSQRNVVQPQISNNKKFENSNNEIRKSDERDDDENEKVASENHLQNLANPKTELNNDVIDISADNNDPEDIISDSTDDEMTADSDFSTFLQQLNPFDISKTKPEPNKTTFELDLVSNPTGISFEDEIDDLLSASQYSKEKTPFTTALNKPKNDMSDDENAKFMEWLVTMKIPTKK